MLLAALLSLFPHAVQQPPATDGQAAPRVQEAPPARIVLVRTSDDFLADGRRFAQALAASAQVGTPICMLVEERLRPLQRDLLQRLPTATIVCVGEPPADLGERTARQVAEPAELFAPGHEAVLTSKHLFDQFEAAVEACRRRLPLLVIDTELAGHIERLGIRKVYRVAARIGVAVPKGLEAQMLDTTASRLANLAAVSAPYLAVANAGAARSFGTGSPLGAAALAAAHGGVLQVIEEKVEFDYAELRAGEAPAGLEPHPAAEWLVGAFDLGDGELPVAVPRVGSGPGIGGVVPRWGDPVVDLDRDGRLDAARETVTLGEHRRIGDRDWSISLRLIGAIGTTKFKDGMLTQRAVRIAPAAETIAAGLRDIYRAAGVIPGALLLAGDHREIPFDYVKDPVYAASMMHEQELASDNLYGDPDGDGYLDIAVGRFVASDRVQATALAARLASHPHWVRAEPPAAALIYPAWADDELKLHLPMIFPSFEALMHGMAADLRNAGCAVHLHLREEGDLQSVLPSLATSSLVVFAHHSGPDGWQFRISQQDGKWQIEHLAPRGHIERGRPGTAVPFLTGAPLIIGAGCDSAGLDYEVVFHTSIVHTFFEQGALGYVGNTRAGFPDTEEFLLRQLLQAALGLQPGTGGPVSIGEAFRQAKNYLDLLIRERGPFRCVTPFEDYSLPMRREWTSLVYYGDPALMLPVRAPAPLVSLRAFEGGEPLVAVQYAAPLQPAKVWFMEQVGVGPLAEVAVLVGPGLTYSSVPWATYADTRAPAVVGPGTYLDLPVPAAIGGATVTLKEGPDWALGGARLITDARGVRRLLASVDLVRYAIQAPEAAERAPRVELQIR